MAAELRPDNDEMAQNERLREACNYMIDKGLKELGARERPDRSGGHAEPSAAAVGGRDPGFSWVHASERRRRCGAGRSA
jgi:hypothetical protein